MTRRPGWLLAGAASLTLVLAACGGGGGSAAPASEAAPSTAASEAPPASDAGAGGGPCQSTTEAGTVQVDIGGRAFAPGRVQAAVGDVISFTNGDAVPHTATLDDDSCTTENLGQGETGSLVFSEPGEYPFHCRIHPDMTGTFEITG